MAQKQKNGKFQVPQTLTLVFFTLWP